MARAAHFIPLTDGEAVMGDESPKATNKAAAEKTNAAKQKNAAAAAKQVVRGKA